MPSATITKGDLARIVELLELLATMRYTNYTHPTNELSYQVYADAGRLAELLKSQVR